VTGHLQMVFICNASKQIENKYLNRHCWVYLCGKII